MMLLSVVTGHILELLTLFSIVLIHELGHAAAALLLGIQVRSIQLLPFGGVAVIEEHGSMTAGKEIIIALAGPLQNVIMMAAAWLAGWAGWGNEAFMDYLIQCNLLIALFNLLPILPLDGGKIVHALASLCWSYHATLLWTSRISILFSAVVTGYALMPPLGGGAIRLNLFMIGVFLLYSNLVDYRNIPYRFVRFLLGRELKYRNLGPDAAGAVPIVSAASKPLEGILRLFRRDKYHLIYIVGLQGTVEGIIPEQRIIASFFASRPR
ncbi:M50 family metallopeptidase [Paenibacillus sp. JX-17]|uniref:M50 family metallopeptidase n=2 Tax=Paenibacillus lacisoli TaxID=3064525 RepID=A0ABT9CGS1_9BACL|nr:M50 family metallopeptidase [Paenibacillus sp. JX-17]MDO7906881.1 M50 family metallopeptidase [Paenibacillus sp. JX-17]